MVLCREEVNMYDDDSGYAMDDPKNPSYHERYASIWDNRDKTVIPLTCTCPTDKANCPIHKELLFEED